MIFTIFIIICILNIYKIILFFITSSTTYGELFVKFSNIFDGSQLHSHKLKNNTRNSVIFIISMKI